MTTHIMSIRTTESNTASVNREKSESHPTPVSIPEEILKKEALFFSRGPTGITGKECTAEAFRTEARTLELDRHDQIRPEGIPLDIGGRRADGISKVEAAASPTIKTRRKTSSKRHLFETLCELKF